jgi:hypothetical protein
MLNPIVKGNLITAFKQLKNSILERKIQNGEIEFILADDTPDWITKKLMPQLLEADEQECFGHEVTYRFLHCIKIVASTLANLDPSNSNWDDDNLIGYITDSIPEMLPKELTEWLDESEDNLFWLTEAMGYIDIDENLKEGVDLLRLAHRLWFTAASNDVIDAITQTIIDTHNN